MPPIAPEQQPSNKARKVSGGTNPSITIPGPALKAAAAAMAAATALPYPAPKVRALEVYLPLLFSVRAHAPVLLESFTKGGDTTPSRAKRRRLQVLNIIQAAPKFHRSGSY